MDIMSRGVTPRAFKGLADFSDRGQFGQQRPLAPLSSFTLVSVWGADYRLAGLAERTGLRNVLSGSDADGDVAVGHRATGDADVRGRHNRPGALINDDARRNIRIHLNAPPAEK